MFDRFRRHHVAAFAAAGGNEEEDAPHRDLEIADGGGRALFELLILLVPELSNQTPRRIEDRLAIADGGQCGLGVFHRRPGWNRCRARPAGRKGRFRRVPNQQPVAADGAARRR